MSPKTMKNKCNTCGKEIEKVGLMSSNSDPAKRQLCMECANKWLQSTQINPKEWICKQCGIYEHNAGVGSTILNNFLDSRTPKERAEDAKAFAESVTTTSEDCTCDPKDKDPDVHHKDCPTLMGTVARMDVSSWLNYGMRFGYQNFFLKKLAGEIMEVVKVDELLANAEGLMDDETRVGKWQEIVKNQIRQGMQSVLDKYNIKL